MTAITTLRASLAAALINEGVWSVYSFPPTSPIANSIIVSPDSPYIEPQNNQYSTISPIANFKITLVVPLLDNQGNLGDIESFAVAVMNKLAASTISMKIGTFSEPTTAPSDMGQMLTADLSISVLTSWS